MNMPAVDISSSAGSTAPQKLASDDIARERQKRIDQHQAAVAGLPANREQTPAATRVLNLLADGDSWFDYPLSGDIIDGVQAGLPQGSLILNLAHYGDATTQLLGVQRRQQLADLMRDKSHGQFDAILFSGGGDDLVGDQFRLWLNDAAAVGGDPAHAINQDALAGILSVVRAAYLDLIATRNAYAGNVPIFVHGYDYAYPTNQGVCWLGPWLYPSLNSRGWMTGLTDEDIARGRGIVTDFLARFRVMLQALAADPYNRVFYVETQGTLKSRGDWANELHPTEAGFTRLAQPFLQALRTKLPPPEV